MNRLCLKYLKEWKIKTHRKPLILHGARQVGKSYLVREFGRQEFEQFIEINFEKNPEFIPLFKSNSPQKILELLELHFKTQLTPDNCLLFLDEIQVAPQVYSSLRYFYEELPTLHIITAGSLLSLLFHEEEFSTPVGRIEYLYLGPMNFEEFLIAKGEEKLQKFLESYELSIDFLDFPETIHKKLLEYVKEFLVLGGMPEVLELYTKGHRMAECIQIQKAVLTTYYEDFRKYAKRIPFETIQKVYQKLPLLIGKKLKYTNIDPGEKSRGLVKALGWLCDARIAYKVLRSSASGLPLRACADELHFKPLFLDVGLMATASGISLLDLERSSQELVLNYGALVEQFVGQHLLFSQEPYDIPELFFWEREKKNAAAEVDYLISEGSKIIPIEVKAGSSGHLKSLHLFLKEKEKNFGVKLSSQLPQIEKKDTTTLLSLPLYFVMQLRRLCRTLPAT